MKIYRTNGVKDKDCMFALRCSEANGIDRESIYMTDNDGDWYLFSFDHPVAGTEQEDYTEFKC